MNRWTIKDHVLGPKKHKPLKYKCYACFDKGHYHPSPKDLTAKFCKCQAGDKAFARAFALPRDTFPSDRLVVGQKKLLDNS